MNRLFKLGFEEEQINIDINSDKIKGKVMNRRLTEKEKKVFLGLVNYPDLPDNRIAEMIDTTRFTVTKIRKRFYEEKLMRTTCIPDIKKLGMNILAFTHSKFNSKVSQTKRDEYLKYTIRSYPTIFHISRNIESMSIAIFKNFREYQESQDELNKYRIENEFLKTEPKTLLLSIPRMTKIKNHTYAPLANKILSN
jgi:hypothetical protein